MFMMLVLTCGLIGTDAARETATPADLAAYETARKKAGNDAGAQVKLALWCEAHGLTAERMKHLALAIAADPTNALARGLSGLVSYHGKWSVPEDVGAKMQTDPAYQALIREYLDRRARTPSKAEAQSKLATWCAEKGLKEQAQAHYSEVTRLDPSRELAWKHLGYKRYGNRWVKPEDAAAQKQELEHQKHADAQWKPRLEKLREGIESSHAARRQKAEEGLALVADPRAVPMIIRVFAWGSERAQIAAVQMLGQLEGPSASTALADLAVSSKSPEVRRRASDTLAHRDPRDVVGRLIALVRRPFKYHVKPGNGPGSTGELFVDGERFDMKRIYQFPKVDFRLAPYVATEVNPSPDVLQAIAVNGAMPMRMPNGRIEFVAGMAEVAAQQRQLMIAAAMAETRQRIQSLEQGLQYDIESIETANVQMQQTNDRVLPVLSALTSQNFGPEPATWQKWWTDQLGYVVQSSQSEKPTFTETVGSPDITIPVPVQVASRPHSACFAAGTLVQTIDGPRAIDSIQIGDRVLSENTSTGLLVFQPVLATHRNDPSPTLRIAVDGETIVATGIHRFWKPGKGWIMARDLRAGDRLRVVGGVVAIQSIEADATQPVYNLDVADNRDFFVGSKGLLVHDFSFVHPVIAPFDREPQMTSTAITPSGR
jgi:tetratricopeptide (TPR) repeat protein